MNLIKIDLILNIYIYINGKSEYITKNITEKPTLPNNPYNRQEVIVTIPRSVLQKPIVIYANRSIEFEDNQLVLDVPHNCALVYVKEQNTWLIKLI